MTEFTFRLILLSLPGITCFFLTEMLVGRKARGTLETVLLILLYTITAYCLHDVAVLVLNALPISVDLEPALRRLLASDSQHSLSSIVGPIGAGIVLSYLVSYARTYSAANRAGQALGATKRYGDEDVWHYFHNAPDREKNGGWVVVRDHRAELAYFGSITVWSDSGTEREIIMDQVSVFSNETGEHMYDIAHLYICRQKHELSIEVPIESGYPPRVETDTSTLNLAEPSQ